LAGPRWEAVGVQGESGLHSLNIGLALEEEDL
jgi:hypothetical protein